MAWRSSLATLGVLLSACAALAQSPTPPASQPAPQAQTVPGETPKSRLDRMFERLKGAKDEVEGKAVAEQVGALLARSGSDTADLMHTRVTEALRAREAEIALDLLDTIIALEPQWAQAYATRATVHIQRKDFDGAMRDLRQALMLEPRHFLALAGLGTVFLQTGAEKRALAAFREVLKIHPQQAEIKKAVERLAAEHDGRDI
jgi:Tfp pilus assembly protein PilF